MRKPKLRGKEAILRRYFLETCTSRRAKTREREPFRNAPGAASSVIGFRQARGARRAARKGGLGHQEPDRGLHVRRAPARGQTSTRVEAAPVGALIGALGTSAIVQRRSTSTEFETVDDSSSTTTRIREQQQQYDREVAKQLSRALAHARSAITPNALTIIQARSPGIPGTII